MSENSAPIIEVVSLSKTYKQNNHFIYALSEINLSVFKQDIYGIIGLSGAGKSTLIRCLAGLITPSEGKILFHGADINLLQGKNLRCFRLKIGMIFQHFNLLSSRTVAGNIAYALEIAGVPKSEQNKRIDELLNLVNLTSKKYSYPASLSGGEKQRVGIARALANSPEMLFCDEATSALDPKNTKEILNLLKTINQKLGVTIVLITHDMEVIKSICNKVAVIEGGKIVEQGSIVQVFTEPQHPTAKHFIQGSLHEIPAEFFKPSSPYRKLLRLRFKGTAANEPLISQMIQKYQVHANILLGWIDHLQTTTVGTLIVELTGSAEGISGALDYLAIQTVHYEVLEQYES